MLRGKNYSVISAEKSIENDKSRIRRKFLFNNTVSFKTPLRNRTTISSLRNQSTMTYEAGNNTMNIINTKMNLTNQSESELTSKNDNKIYDMQHIPERMMTNSNRFEDITSNKNTYESSNKKFRRSFQNVIENSKVISMFIDSNKYDGSAIGLIDEEHSLTDENKGCYTNSQFRSMNDVKEMNQRMIKISMRRFIKCKGVIKIVQFDYDDYDSIVNSHELIRKKIKMKYQNSMDISSKDSKRNMRNI